MPHPQVFSCLGNRKLGNGKGEKGGRERGRWKGDGWEESEEDGWEVRE